MNENDHHTIELLRENWKLLVKSLETLKMSVAKAESIGKKENYSFEEMETFDSLTSKFSRTSDIFYQKVLRSVWMLLHEEPMPFIDILNKAEKINLINSADKLIMIRDLRNQIAHEYIPEAIQKLIPEVIELSNDLDDSINLAGKFLIQRSWISE